MEKDISVQNVTQISLKKPYLLFIGEVSNATYVKTAAGLVEWKRGDVAGQLRFKNNPLTLGVPDLSIEQAVGEGAKSIVVGVAPVGGVIGAKWIDVLCQAARAGLDVVSGLHRRLDSYPELKKAAEISGSRLIDIRIASNRLPIGLAIKRSGKRVLMVGTDCAVGKKYTALALTKALDNSGIKATFRATGQTGIIIAGEGVPVDAVIADFISGAAEVISPDNLVTHWDVIEGQGSLFNPSYSGVSLGLLHGSQPDAVIVCHDASREVVSSCPHLPIPSVADCIELTLTCGRIVNPAIQCIGISVNTSSLSPKKRQQYLQTLSSQTGLPCFDPLIDGCESVVTTIKGINGDA
jgi:D-glutamate N-acetyltransferase